MLFSCYCNPVSEYIFFPSEVTGSTAKKIIVFHDCLGHRKKKSKYYNYKNIPNYCLVMKNILHIIFNFVCVITNVLVQCGTYLYRNFHNYFLNSYQLSKTTKLLLLDSLLQEVCIESGFDGSFILINFGMRASFISHNSLYLRLKKAYLMILLTCTTLTHLTQEGYIWINFHSMEISHILCHLTKVWCQI